MTTRRIFVQPADAYAPQAPGTTYALELFHLLRDMEQVIRQIPDETAILEYAIDRLPQAMQLTEGAAFLYDGRHFSTAINPYNGKARTPSVPLQPAQLARLTELCDGNVCVVTNLLAYPNLSISARGLIAVPLVSDDEVLGIIVLVDYTADELLPVEEQLLRLVGHQLAGCLHEKRLQHHLNAALCEFTAQHDSGAAYTDMLTGLLNYDGLCLELQQVIAQAGQQEDALALLMIRVDRWQEILAGGISYGDRVLTLVAEVLRKGIRASDLITRYSEDIFCVLLFNTSIRHAAAIAERLRTRIASLLPQGLPDSREITVSIGISHLPPQTGTAEQLTGSALEGLNDASRRGGDQIIVAAGS